MTDQNTKLAFIFPGQGSQAVGMGKELAQSFPLAMDAFQEADEILGFPLSKLAWEGPAEELNDTANTQPALFVHSVAVLRVLQQSHPEIKPAYLAGHSLGEFTALAAAGSLSFSEGLKLVRARGELMREAGNSSPGQVAAILGLSIEQVEQIVKEASQQNQPAAIANDNCPGQVVISGAGPAVERAIELAKAAGAKRVLPLNVSVAVHSPLMRQAQNGLLHAMEKTAIQSPKLPVIGNVSARPLNSAAEVRQEIQEQLISRVRWTESMEYLVAMGVTDYFELGNGNVLSGLLRRIEKTTRQIPLGAPSDFENLVL